MTLRAPTFYIANRIFGLLPADILAEVLDSDLRGWGVSAEAAQELRMASHGCGKQATHVLP